jgi:hypothetical protein
MDDLATELEARVDRVRFAIATADPVAGECLPHMGYLATGSGRFATRWFAPDARRLYARFAASIGPMVRQCARLEPAPWEDALEAALRRLENAGFAWWLYGSAALAVRGIPVAPADVDLHVGDPFAAGRLFDDVLVTPVERLDGWVAAYVGRAFDGAVVEWLAEPHAALDDPDDPHEQGPFVAGRLETVRWRGHDVRVPPLAVQLRTCERRGLTERAALIRRALARASGRSR